MKLETEELVVSAIVKVDYHELTKLYNEQCKHLEKNDYEIEPAYVAEDVVNIYIRSMNTKQVHPILGPADKNYIIDHFLTMIGQE